MMCYKTLVFLYSICNGYWGNSGYRHRYIQPSINQCRKRLVDKSSSPAEILYSREKYCYNSEYTCSLVVQCFLCVHRFSVSPTLVHLRYITLGLTEHYTLIVWVLYYVLSPPPLSPSFPLEFSHCGNCNLDAAWQICPIWFEKLWKSLPSMVWAEFITTSILEHTISISWAQKFPLSVQNFWGVCFEHRCSFCSEFGGGGGRERTDYWACGLHTCSHVQITMTVTVKPNFCKTSRGFRCDQP